MTVRPTAPRFPLVAWLEARTRRQRQIALALVALVALAGIARLAAGFALDRWWFASVTDSDVWATKVGAQLQLAVAAAIVTGLVLIGGTVLALRTEPAPGNAPNRLLLHYRERMGPAHRWVMLAATIYLTIHIAVAAMGVWQPWLLFLHGPSLGQTVPDVGWDLGYHLFRLPFLLVVSSWLRQIVLVAGGFALVAHIVNGAIKLPRPGRTSAPAALRQLGAFAAAFAVLQALDYVFVRWPDNATNEFGAFDGPGYTQVNVVIPALVILTGVAVICALAAAWGMRTNRWRPALWAFAGWAALQVVLIAILPAAVERFVVKPAEAVRELPHIARNLEATRTAYGLDAVEQVTQPFTDGITGSLAPEVRPTLDTVPLFSEPQLVAPLQVLQGTTGTRITDVDLDRYEIDGRMRPVLITTRNANRADLPERGWVQLHLVYTHGDGVVAVPADAAAPDGRPDVDAFAEALADDRSELYFGEGLSSWYAIVGTRRAELGGTAFAADTGIPLSSLWRRLALALTVGEVEPVVSAELTPDSQLLYRRELRERLGTLAPFLSFDGEAYPVVADGRVVWIIDGYTTASTYPYAQYARNAGLPDTSGLAGRSFNFLHASVKATVDAYDGAVHLYRTEVGGANDPILDTWESVYPGLIEPIAEMPPAVRTHLLYPRDLLTVQTSMLGRYHVDDPETLFNGTDSWAVSAAAGAGVARGGPGEAAPSPGPAPAVSLFMPESEPLGGHWVAIRPFGPGAANNPTSTRDELAALAIADHDDPEHLRLVRIAPRAGRQISSPLVAQSAIDTDRELAALFTLLNANGSVVQFGPLTPIPLDGALVWIRPIIVSGTASTTTPRLYGVTAVSNGLVGQGDTVADALEAAIARTPAS